MYSMKLEIDLMKEMVWPLGLVAAETQRDSNLIEFEAGGAVYFP